MRLRRNPPSAKKKLDHQPDGTPHTRESLKRMIGKTLFQAEAYTKLDKVLGGILLGAHLALLGAALFIAVKAVVVWSLAMWVPNLILLAYSVLVYVTMKSWYASINGQIEKLDWLVPSVLRAKHQAVERAKHATPNIIRVPIDPIPAH